MLVCFLKSGTDWTGFLNIFFDKCRMGSIGVGAQVRCEAWTNLKRLGCLLAPGEVVPSSRSTHAVLRYQKAFHAFLGYDERAAPPERDAPPSRNQQKEPQPVQDPCQPHPRKLWADWPGLSQKWHVHLRPAPVATAIQDMVSRSAGANQKLFHQTKERKKGSQAKLLVIAEFIPWTTRNLHIKTTKDWSFVHAPIILRPLLSLLMLWRHFGLRKEGLGFAATSCQWKVDRSENVLISNPFAPFCENVSHFIFAKALNAFSTYRSNVGNLLPEMLPAEMRGSSSAFYSLLDHDHLLGTTISAAFSLSHEKILLSISVHSHAFTFHTSTWWSASAALFFNISTTCCIGTTGQGWMGRVWLNKSG